MKDHADTSRSHRGVQIRRSDLLSARFWDVVIARDLADTNIEKAYISEPCYSGCPTNVSVFFRLCIGSPNDVMQTAFYFRIADQMTRWILSKYTKTKQTAFEVVGCCSGSGSMGRSQAPSWFSTDASQQDTLAAVSLCVDGIFLVDLLMLLCCT